jgi:signal transduction histidine kinase/ligand-binding sensor domain-containing protein
MGAGRFFVRRLSYVMQKRLRAAAAALCLAGLLSPSVRAAEPRELFDKYHLTTWGSTDGLTASTVWALAQDTLGYLWLGTDVGLFRFDGVRFSRFTSYGPTQLTDAPIRALHVTREGSLWVGFGSLKGASRVRAGQVVNFSEQDGMPPNDVTAIVEDPTGAIWAGGSAGLMRFSGQRWEAWQPGHGLPAGAVYSASTDREGGLLVGTSSGVFRKRAGRSGFEPVEFLEGKDSVADFSRRFGGDVVRAVLEDHAGNVWVTDPAAGVRGLDRWQRSEERGRGAALLNDNQGNLWVGTWAQGLWRITYQHDKPLRIERATNIEGFVGDEVRSLLEDRDGNIWVGTLDGVHRLSPIKVNSLTSVGLVSGVGATPDGSVWFRNADDVFQFKNGVTKKHDELRRLTRNLYRGFDIDPSGIVWISTRTELIKVAGDGASLVNLGNRRLTSINTIASDRLGGVWLHDIDQGLLHWRNNRLETSPLPTVFEGARVESIQVDNTARAWVSFADSRLVTIDRDDTVTVHDRPDDIGVYQAIFQDRQGAVWLGATRGLSRYEGGRFMTLRRTEAFPADSITAIVEDESGILWIGVASGVLRVDRSEFERAAADGAIGLRHSFYDTSDGIAGTPRWFGKQSAARAPDGRLWFVTSRGLSILDPRILSPSRPTSNVNIESVTANGQSLEAIQDMSLPARTVRLEVDYSMPTLTSPLKTRFRYRLEGFDNDWVFAGTRRQAYYTGLRPGNYRFQVVAGNSEGDWAEPGAVLSLSVQPVFYQTTWFLAVGAVAFVAVLGTAWRLRLAHLRKQFSMILGERVRLSREIHDTLLQSLVGVALQCDALANDLTSLAPATKEQFYRLRRDVEDHVREARQAIWNLRSPILDRRDLVSALRFVGQQAVVGSGIDLDVVVQGQPRPCSEQLEGQLLRIGQEAVINAVRHASATHIKIELDYRPDAVVMRIADDGRGFAPEHVVPDADRHYGLVSMRERAETVGGRLQILSRIGHGTTVETSVSLAELESSSHA